MIKTEKIKIGDLMVTRVTQVPDEKSSKPKEAVKEVAEKETEVVQEEIPVEEEAPAIPEIPVEAVEDEKTAPKKKALKKK